MEMLRILNSTITTITTTVYFLQFACDLGIVANVSPKVFETSEEPGFKKPKKASKQNIEISWAIFEAMKYKLALTSNKLGILEIKSEVHNKFDQNANLSGPKQSCAATKT